MVHQNGRENRIKALISLKWWRKERWKQEISLQCIHIWCTHDTVFVWSLNSNASHICVAIFATLKKNKRNTFSSGFHQNSQPGKQEEEYDARNSFYIFVTMNTAKITKLWEIRRITGITRKYPIQIHGFPKGQINWVLFCGSFCESLWQKSPHKLNSAQTSPKTEGNFKQEIYATK